VRLLPLAILLAACTPEEKCDPIVGHLIDETTLCVDFSPEGQVTIGCRDEHFFTRPVPTCWEHEETGEHAFTWEFFYEPPNRGWNECSDAYASTVVVDCE
jgi:hypothetical protein